MVLNRLMVMAGVGAHALKTARSLDKLLGPLHSGHINHNFSRFGQKLMANKIMHLSSWGKGFTEDAHPPNFMEDEEAAVQELISALNDSSDAQVRAAVMEAKMHWEDVINRLTDEELRDPTVVLEALRVSLDPPAEVQDASVDTDQLKRAWLDCLRATKEDEGRVVLLRGLPNWRNRKFFYTHPAQMRMIWNKFLDRLSALDRRKLLNNTIREDEIRAANGNEVVNKPLLIDVLVQYELKQAFKPIMNFRLASKTMQLPLMDEETHLMQTVIENTMAPLIEDFIAYSQWPETRSDNYRFFTHQMIRSLFGTYLKQLQAMMDNLLNDEHLDPNLFVTDETYIQHIAQLLDSLLQPAVDTLMALPADDEYLKFKCSFLRPLMAKCSESTRMEVLTVPDSEGKKGWKLASEKYNPVTGSLLWKVEDDDVRREQMKKYVGNKFLRERRKIYMHAAEQSHFPSADDKKLVTYVDDFLMPNQPL